MDDLFEEFKSKLKGKVDSSLEETFAKVLELTVKLIDESTEYGQNELKALSIGCRNKYISEYFKDYRQNKKFVKRKRTNELIEALDKICKSIGASINHDSDIDDLEEKRSRH